MNPMELLITMRKQGIEMEASGDRIRLVGPGAKLTGELAAIVRDHKERLLQFLNDPSTRWRLLAATGLGAQQVIRLDDALFLFAIRKVQHAVTDAELAAIWRQHSRYWQKRLETAAWQIVLDEYKQRQKRKPQHQGKTC
jgi:hypothetical protein